ncbi:ABC transporter permease subunit, partial [Bacillus toyonensis]
VPHNVKEASLGLGATKWQTIARIIIPSSLPQIITGVILAAGRIFGEAAALIYTAGLTSPILNSAADFSSPAHPLNPFRPAETLAVHIWKLNSEGIIPDAKLIATKSAAVLIIMVLLFNVISRLIASVLHKRFTGTKRKSKTTKKVKAA